MIFWTNWINNISVITSSDQWLHYTDKPGSSGEAAEVEELLYLPTNAPNLNLGL